MEQVNRGRKAHWKAEWEDGGQYRAITSKGRLEVFTLVACERCGDGCSTNSVGVISASQAFLNKHTVMNTKDYEALDEIGWSDYFGGAVCGACSDEGYAAERQDPRSASLISKT